MDMEKIGQFLSALRKERVLTQEQLGEKLGVTNKTVSRWETGAYLPPVEMLQQLSEFYGVSINEILSAQRLNDAQYRQKAEENIRSVLDASPFDLQEKISYYKKKWKRDHVFETVLGFAVILTLYVLGFTVNLWWSIGASFAVLGFVGWRNNAMMTYVEARAFDGSGRR